MCQWIDAELGPVPIQCGVNANVIVDPMYTLTFTDTQCEQC